MVGMVLGGAVLGVFILVAGLIRELVRFVGTLEGKITLGVALVSALWAMNRQFNELERKRLEELERVKALQEKINEVKISSRREDYLFDEDDYRRGNKKENLYRKRFKLTLLLKFENACGKCGRSDNGVDLDHFVISKNEGGCFVLRHRDGFLVNNAIVLCSSCNRSKSDDPHEGFFTQEELVRIYRINSEMTKLLNEAPFVEEWRKKIA
jgi:hypothetical protein